MLMPVPVDTVLMLEILKRRAMSNEAQTTLLRGERSSNAITQNDPEKSVDQRDQILISSRVSGSTIDADRRCGRSTGAGFVAPTEAHHS